MALLLEQVDTECGVVPWELTEVPQQGTEKQGPTRNRVTTGKGDGLLNLTTGANVNQEHKEKTGNKRKTTFKIP